MRNIAIIFLYLLTLSQGFCAFSDFAQLPVKKALPEPIIRSIPKAKKIKKLAKKQKELVIKTAIIWQLPDRNFLGNKLTKYQEKNIDKEALEKFILGAQTQNPELFRVYSSQNKKASVAWENKNGVVKSEFGYGRTHLNWRVQILDYGKK